MAPRAIEHRANPATSLSMNLAHLILTKFNIRPASPTSLDPGWLEDRLCLFFRYTFPSVAAQDVRSFSWLVFIHPDTPASVKLRLQRDRAAANMHVVETPSFDHPEFAARTARKHIGSGATHLVTTTLDSDDALARSFVGQVHRHARAVEFELINFVEGLRLVERTGALYHCRLRSNTFITAVEKLEQAKTIWGYLPHGTILERFPEVRDVISGPLFLQVVHGGNISATGPWGLRRARAAELRRHFSVGADVYLDEQAGLQFWLENVRRRFERLLIDRLDPKARAGLRYWVRRLRPASYRHRGQLEYDLPADGGD
jgi:Putative rhamnosyl transferase